MLLELNNEKNKRRSWNSTVHIEMESLGYPVPQVLQPFDSYDEDGFQKHLDHLDEIIDMIYEAATTQGTGFGSSGGARTKDIGSSAWSSSKGNLTDEDEEEGFGLWQQNLINGNNDLK